jgi:hypothetical protein
MCRTQGRPFRPTVFNARVDVDHIRRRAHAREAATVGARCQIDDNGRGLETGRETTWVDVHIKRVTHPRNRLEEVGVFGRLNQHVHHVCQFGHSVNNR